MDPPWWPNKFRAANDYYPKSMITRGRPVIVVSFNYRLNIFAFFPCVDGSRLASQNFTLRRWVRPMMRRGAGLNTHEAGLQLLEERQDVAALQLTADEHLAFCIDAVDLKDRFCDVETDSRTVCMIGSSESWER
jgi:hypothetical protein